MIAHINDLICAKDFKTAIVLISQFKLHDDFDRREIVTILMSKNHTDCYELLVKDKTDLEFLQVKQNFYIHLKQKSKNKMK